MVFADSDCDRYTNPSLINDEYEDAVLLRSIGGRLLACDLRDMFIARIIVCIATLEQRQALDSVNEHGEPLVTCGSGRRK